MEKFFNTAGPNKPDMHYEIDPLSRFDLSEVLMLIRQQKYFVMHAPRQTGKTTCMLALRDYLNKSGDYVSVYANVEGVDEGHLVVFDRSGKTTWEERLWHRPRQQNGRTIMVWGM